MKPKRMLLIIFLTIGFIGLCIGGYALYGMYQMKKLPSLTAKACHDYTLQGNPDGVITIGILKDGVSSYRVYGEDSRELPQVLHTYEIGSITKTFTAGLIYRAVADGKLSLESSIDECLPLPPKDHYPTIRQLLTHTSGYSGFYFEKPMVSNFFRGRNDFYGITKAMHLDRLKKEAIAEKEYPFQYSNFGYATLGLVLEQVYGKSYTELVNAYAQELGLKNTHISSGGDLGNLWDWGEDDAYMAAGALTSDVEDMLAYAAFLLNDSPTLEPLAKANVSNPKFDLSNVHIDEVAYGWIYDNKNDIIWHDGGTGNYNCYLGLDMENQTAVVVLSNLPPSYKIPATVIGIKIIEEMRENYIWDF